MCNAMAVYEPNARPVPQCRLLPSVKHDGAVDLCFVDRDGNREYTVLTLSSRGISRWSGADFDTKYGVPTSESSSVRFVKLADDDAELRTKAAAREVARWFSVSPYRVL